MYSKPKVQKERSAKRDDQIARPKRVQTCARWECAREAGRFLSLLSCEINNLIMYNIIQARIYTRATWEAAQGGASKRAAKMWVYVHLSSKFLNINFQYLKTKKSRSLILWILLERNHCFYYKNSDLVNIYWSNSGEARLF